jgi:hypothetical protein
VDWFSLLAGAFIAATAYSSGVGIGIKRGRAVQRRKQEEPPKLTCSCKHGYGMHEHGGKCQGTVKEPNKWKNYYVGSYLHTDAVCWQYETCPCLTYDGPQPLPTYEQMIGVTGPPPLEEKA